MITRALRQNLEALYAKYNRPQFIKPDPLQFVVECNNAADAEIVGLIASSLAFGAVGQIIKSVSLVLEALPEPRRCLREMSPRELSGPFGAFRHRYVNGQNLSDLLIGMRHILKRYGSLQNCFLEGLDEGHDTILPALETFVSRLREGFDCRKNYLVCSPAEGSACKRMHLYLRWMVRRDAVDPGPWSGVTASKLIIPLDTHMHRVALRLGMTARKQGNQATALEITKAFSKIQPDDPVKYDFALTRPGIRKEAQNDPFWGPIFGPEPF